MSAQGNTLGFSSRQVEAPTGRRYRQLIRAGVFRTAPLALVFGVTSIPRALPGADIGLARWAETQLQAICNRLECASSTGVSEPIGPLKTQLTEANCKNG